MNRKQATDLIRTMMALGSRCPAHGGTCSHGHHRHAAAAAPDLRFNPDLNEYAVEMSSSTLRYGSGVTREIGMDLKNMNCKKAAVFTDPQMARLPPYRKTIQSIEAAGVNYVPFPDVRAEPTDKSVKAAIDFAKKNQPDIYVAVGGGSVMDTSKIANLYENHPECDFLEFVAAPIGKGQVPFKSLKPLIAIPTTAGTGSETTGTAVFDFEDIRAKTGIQHKALRPTLGLVDPDHLAHAPPMLTAYAGFDVLCHGIESYTNLPFTDRKPRPLDPKYRPAYQGSNPISDVWSSTAVKICHQFLRRSFNDASDVEARSNMHLASCFAGVGFGNAGVHLCHGLSYAISGQVKSHRAAGYPSEYPLIPHGLSVVITAPAVFKATAPSNPERHLLMAELLGADISNAKREDAGNILSDCLKQFMQDLKVENGLQALGYEYSDIDSLVKSTIPQDRVLALSPIGRQTEQIAKIFEESLTAY